MAFEDADKKIPYYRSLDGLRGFAMVLVVMNHTHVFRFGWVGIQIFFVLSGFLITSILLREKEKPLSLKIKFKNFWVRRVLRIFPMYYLYLFFLVALWQFNGDWQTQSGNLPWLFTYTFNLQGLFVHTHSNFMIAHLWSLSLEEQFYLIYPFLVLLCGYRPLRLIVISLIFLTIAFRFFAGEYLTGSGWQGERVGAFIYSFTFSHWDAFLLGGSIVLFDLKKVSLRWSSFAFVVLFLLMIVLGLGMYVHLKPGSFDFNDYLTHLGYTPGTVEWQHHVWGYLVIDLLFASLLLLLIIPGKNFLNTTLSRFFSFTPFPVIGKISYGMYIIQPGLLYLILSACHHFHIYNRYVIFCISLPLLCVVAAIIYHVYEKRFLAMKARYR